MSKRFWSLSAVFLTLVPAALAPATSVATTSGAAAPSGTAVPTQQARFGARGFGRRPAFGSRYRTRSPYTRAYRRPGLFHGVFGGVLKLLGIAYLFHLFFGIGAGGSPLGLLLLVALFAYVAGRRGRRPRRTLGY